jgi:hypothetical protein
VDVSNSFEGLPVDPCVDLDDDLVSSKTTGVEKVTKVVKSVRIKCKRCDRYLYGGNDKVCKRCMNHG